MTEFLGKFLAKYTICSLPSDKSLFKCFLISILGSIKLGMWKKLTATSGLWSFTSATLTLTSAIPDLREARLKLWSVARTDICHRFVFWRALYASRRLSTRSPVSATTMKFSCTSLPAMSLNSYLTWPFRCSSESSASSLSSLVNSGKPSSNSRL